MLSLIFAAFLVAQAPAAQDLEPLHLQVLLDRAGFSPGAIDGQMGAKTTQALAAFERAGHQLSPDVPATSTYRITAADAAGPFTPDIPRDLPAQARLKALGYRSVLEMLAERFHASQALLERLNPESSFAEGDEIVVPNVEPMILPAPAPDIKAKKPPEQIEADKQAAEARMAERPEVTVTVSKSTSALTVTGPGGRVIMHAPVTTGSERDPLPIGEWKVNGVALNPVFRYNPDLFWDADPTHTKALLPPGPNNPVGVVWVDLSKEHYGIHGTPEPEAIARTQSHGCVRLTNWDALRLAGMVKPGTRVVFTE
jgi:lipoprotein-anchoring transpeptidase ErfK/SrfK